MQTDETTMQIRESGQAVDPPLLDGVRHCSVEDYCGGEGSGNTAVGI